MFYQQKFQYLLVSILRERKRVMIRETQFYCLATWSIFHNLQVSVSTFCLFIFTSTKRMKHLYRLFVNKNIFVKAFQIGFDVRFFQLFLQILVSFSIRGTQGLSHFIGTVVMKKI